MTKIYLKNNSEYIEISKAGSKINGSWVKGEIRSIFQKHSGVWTTAITGDLAATPYVFGGYIPTAPEGVVSLSIEGASKVNSTSSEYVLLANGVETQTDTWAIISGGTYATISSAGTLTVNSNANNSPIVIQATLDDLTATKEIYATYNTVTSAETTTTTTVDESGNTTTTVTTVTDNGDGTTTSESTTITYNIEGEPVEKENENTDEDGNVSTQEIVYNEDGQEVVTAYTIDTSASGSREKTFNGDGVNTEYYAFDMTQGFVVDMAFTVDCSNNPPGQNENHHNILTAKRATPSPWYGFQLRQSNTNKYIQLGTQFSGGTNTNTTIQPASITGNTAEYNLRIKYDPTSTGTTFTCYDMTNDTVVYSNTGKFPDIDELKYLKVTIGYAMDANGDPYRYSNINVKNFSIRRLTSVSNPVITCDGETVSITCATVGATIYYRLNEVGVYAEYTDSFPITADTIVEAYAELNGEVSSTVSENCEYEPVVLAAPTITCNGTQITLNCSTQGASIYYKLDHTGEYALYSEPITITADTFVEAYSELNGETSTVVSQTCEYDPEHDYSQDYLTFRVLSGGTIAWNSLGSGQAKTIQYSLNNGEWTTITASTSTTISVSAGDVVRFKGTNTSYAGSNANYSGFDGGTATFNIEGNIMSLVYGDNFIGNTGLTGTYNFCSLFKNSNVISAENLILPATTLTAHCYRALFAQCYLLEEAPELPATTLADSCYRYMFQDAAITTAPDLLATTLLDHSYEGMFNRCSNLNYIKCLATDISATSATTAWTQAVSTTGTFVKDANAEWPTGVSGIPTRWTVIDEGLANPTVSCDGLYITLECTTQGASIYYRLNESGTYSAYTTPISITADTVVEAYSQLGSDTSSIVKENCIYDDGITEPTIYCDGEYITLSCDTGGASIYYRLNQQGTFTQYSEAIVITADTICEAYSEIDGRRSETVTANCEYDDSLKAPRIECNGIEVTITCNTVGADIYYRLNEEGTYSAYTAAIAITADTIVEAYSELGVETSQTVSQNCIYDPTHDYSLDYLTLRARTDGKLYWRANGGVTKSISYSLNDGAWTTITSNATPPTISVTTGDVVRFKGTNTSYATSKSGYTGFGYGELTANTFDADAAEVDVEGNIMSLVYGDNFVGNTGLTGIYNFCSLFKKLKVVSAENLVLPAMTLTNYCYRAMFSWCTELVVAPALPATTLKQGCYWYMFESCAITTAPDLPAETLVAECYGNMFTSCASLNYIKCMAVSGFTANNCKQNWTKSVAANGTFVKDGSVDVTTWSRGINGIPTNWLVYDNVSVSAPSIACDGYNNVTISCDTQGATIYYRLDEEGTYSAYTTAITITANTVVESYAELSGQESRVVKQTCEYISDDPYEASNRNLYKWNYNNVEVSTPYSVNQLDGHSSSYAKGTFNFETSFALREAQPTYLWFQHADQSASIYVDDTLVEKHWGGYTSFFVDITSAVHSGTNEVKVALKNNEGNSLAPAAGDFNFNATLGNVKLYTSPYLPAMNYGYDGFHITSNVSTTSATINVTTSIPTGATVVCSISGVNCNYTATSASTNAEMTFTTTITNPRLWNGTIDPYLYEVKLEIYHNNELYHRYVRPYGLRFYEYVINEEVNGDTYTGFLLNGSPYLLRGVCMHDDIDGKANALDDADYTQTFSIIQELGCNFIRLAHYPHPKETYDWCDRLGIVVQTEGPCVNKMQSTMPSDYYTHLTGQYDDMVNQHYNHPCILFWGLSNETTTDDKEFANTKINGYISQIKALDSERMVGYVMAQAASDPSAYYNNPNADWFGCNIYEGWYSNKDSNNPTSAINTRVRNIITNKSKALAYSEYGCGGTQRCHSDDFMNTTTRGNYERHDIEYMMWLHEGHIATIKQYPQLLFTAQWQLFDIAVANRNEGYTVCLDGVNTSTDDSLRRLNNKGLVERDHITKKDPFYLYKAWWNPTPFVHICGKNYTKTTDRTIKCYTNGTGTFTLYVNNTSVATATPTDNILEFASQNFNSGDVVRVDGTGISDTFTFGN